MVLSVIAYAAIGYVAYVFFMVAKLNSGLNLID
jgi:hypothetical protein